MVCKDGSRVIVVLDGRIAHDEEGAFKRTHCILHNITDRKRAEEALQESEGRYRAVVETRRRSSAAFGRTVP